MQCQKNKWLVDADLNAGIITSEEAKTRRSEIAKEGEFYGAMDGAAKFVGAMQ